MQRKSRGERLILIGIAVLSCVVHAIAYFRWRFDSDEPQHLHVAWGWTAGLLQYRDVFDNHAPLFHILTAPMLKAVGERADVLLYMRAPMVLLFAVVVWSTYIIGRRLYTERIGLWAAVMISLFPIYFLKSIEYRTDNLWVALWCLTLVALTGGRLTSLRMFAAGLILGCAAATSMKTSMLLISLAAAALVMWLVVEQGRNVLPAIAGVFIVPSIIVTYFAARGAWKNLYYGVIQFNALIESATPRNDRLLKALVYFPLLLLLLWITRLRRPAGDDSVVRWRFFLAFTTAFFSITLFAFWVLISPRDFLAILPIVAIFFAAAIDRVDIRLPLYIATCFVFTGLIWYYTHGFDDGVTEHVTLMRQVLGVSRPGEPLLDLKGETIYRPRPYYYIFEFITRRLMRGGIIADTIPEDVVRANCYVVQADGPFLPSRGRAFLRENFIDLGRLRAAGQWLEDDGSFSTAIPGSYVILNANGQATGDLDGLPYRGERMLAPGRHTFVTTGQTEPLAFLWAPAFIRGYSPFHLRDREFPHSRIYDSPNDGSRTPSGRRHHRRWGPRPTGAGKRR